MATIQLHLRERGIKIREKGDRNERELGARRGVGHI